MAFADCGGDMDRQQSDDMLSTLYLMILMYILHTFVHLVTISLSPQ